MDARTQSLLALGAGAACLAVRCFRSRPSFEKVPGLPFLGPVSEVKGGDALVEAMERWAGMYGKDKGVYEFMLLGKRWIVIHGSEALQQTLALRPFRATRMSAFQQTMSDLIPGLFLAEGDAWKKERRLMAPAFNAKNVEGYFPYVKDVIATAMQDVTKRNSTGGKVNVTEVVKCMTSEVVATVAFGESFGAFHGSHSELKLVDELFEGIMARIQIPFPYWKLPFLGSLAPGAAARAKLADVLTRYIEKEKQAGAKSTILAKLRESEESNQMTHEEFVGNIVTMFVAGTDTTSLTLSWALHMLAQHPDIQEEAAGEVASKAPQGVQNEAHLAELKLSQAVWAEAGRLHSAAPYVILSNLEPFQLAGVPVPRDSTLVLLSRYEANHGKNSAAFGGDIEKFKPKRWLTESGELRADAGALQSHAFGYGARACVGRKLAELEGVLFLAEFLRLFKISGADSAVQERSSFTQGPDRDILLTVTSR